MSDDTKGADAQAIPDGDQKKADAASEQEAKPWRNEAEIKKIIADRDKAEAKLKEIAEKEKKQAEEKAIADGKTKEILAQKEAELADAKKKAELYEQEQKAIREQALAQITDDEVRAMGEELSTPKLLALAKKFNTERGHPFSSRAPMEQPTDDLKARPGETQRDYEIRMQNVFDKRRSKK